MWKPPSVPPEEGEGQSRFWKPPSVPPEEGEGQSRFLSAWLCLGTQIYTDLERFFYLLYLLNLREAFADWLCLGTQIAARVALALRAPVRSRALRGYHRSRKFFYLLYLLDLRETLFGTQMYTDWER